ncbi:MAG: MFS transporter [Parachlamydiaceae bacterium]
MPDYQNVTDESDLKRSFLVCLFVAFIDHMGVGLIYPLFSAMLFDYSLQLLPLDTAPEVRGVWLGILIALMPLAQFFSAPIWGAISDQYGRKRPLQLSLSIGIGGYLVAFLGVLFSHIGLLLASRLIIGIASGNTSIVQAAIVDLSPRDQKARNFGLYGMALGAGFTLGPFFGGSLSTLGYGVPFLFALILTFLNLLFAIFFFKETHQFISTYVKNCNWLVGINHLVKAFSFKGVRSILLCSFLHNFGWSYFFEFIPVYLMEEFEFSTMTLGIFYGVAGCFYGLSTGWLIQPFVKRLRPEILFFAGNLCTAIAILAILTLQQSLWIWPQMFLICYFVAFVTPSAITLVSNYADDNAQGEALGILSSVNAAALAASPLFSGSFVGKFPTISIIVGGATLAMTALLLVIFKRPLFKINWRH